MAPILQEFVEPAFAAWWPSNVLSRAVRSFLTRFEGPDAYLYFKYAAPEYQQSAHVGFGFSTWSLGEPVHALSLVGQDFRAWSRWQHALASYDWMSDKREASVQSFMLLNMRFLMQQLLQRLDRMLMIHSIEGRVPFLENSLFDFALNLPLSQKIRRKETKYLLKQVALRYLPSDVVTRGKMGFTVPWLTYADKFPQNPRGRLRRRVDKAHARRVEGVDPAGRRPVVQTDRDRSVGPHLRA